jgi:colanic acid/amylovoran biosynthesis glycosyltransferase
MSPAPDQPFSVAYLAAYYPKTSHRFIWREIVGLEARGVRIERFATRPSPDTPPDSDHHAELKKTKVLLDEGVLRLAAAMVWAAVTRPRRFLDAWRTAMSAAWRSDRGFLAHVAYVAEASALLRCLTRRPVDHLHAHFANNTASIAMLCRIMGGPSYSFTAHGPDDFDRAPLLGLEEKIARAKVVFSVSYFGRGQLLRWCKYRDWSKVHVLDPGVDHAFFLPPTPVPSSRRLVCVGRLHEQKGQSILLDTVHRLRGDGVACEVILIGDGPMRAEIEQRIRDLQMDDCISLAGAASTDVMIGLIQSARALVLPSLAENFPSVILEVFALARPVIATYVGGIAELVHPGVSGWLVPAGDIDSLADAIRDALDTPVSRLQEMGWEGYRRVISRHKPEMFAQQLLSKFRNADEK